MSIYTEQLSLIRSAIRSILEQSYTDFEFLIALDNPKRNEVISLLQKFQEQDPRIRFFINEKNIGLANSLNSLLTQAKGDYIFRMDADDISYPERFERQLIFMHDNNLDICGTDLATIDLNGTINYYAQSAKEAEDPSFIAQQLRFHNLIAHPSWCVKRSVYQALNGYRNMVPAEDYDFLCRAVVSGFKIARLTESLLYYRTNPYGVSNALKHKQRAMTLVIQEYFDELNKRPVDFLFKKQINLLN